MVTTNQLAKTTSFIFQNDRKLKMCLSAMLIEQHKLTKSTNVLRQTFITPKATRNAIYFYM